jgi:hypothetical protein
MNNLKTYNPLLLLLSVLLWLTFWLGPIFMITLGVYNIYSSIKIYSKLKTQVIVYWILVAINLVLMFLTFKFEIIELLSFEFFSVVIVAPYLLSIYLIYLINKI